MGDHEPLLHEILAIEQNVKANAERAQSQLVETFRTTQSHFTGTPPLKLGGPMVGRRDHRVSTSLLLPMGHGAWSM